jgi:branched-chain amino acid aminotransferase
MFGAGTACVVSPIASISYKNMTISIPTGSQENPLYRRLERALTSIQYGRVEHPWAVTID